MNLKRAYGIISAESLALQGMIKRRENVMSILTVEHVTHGFGGRQILEDASFRLLKGEHIGLVGANGEGKSTFLNIITGKLMPDQGTVEWCKHITTGYLDQYSSLTPGKTIRDVLREAFLSLTELEQEMLAMYDKDRKSVV